MTYRTSGGSVTSVAGRTGAVTLTSTDIGDLQSVLGQLSVAAGNVSTVEFGTQGVDFNQTLNEGAKQSFLAYQIASGSSDQSNLLMLSIDLVELSGIGAKYTWSLWAGDPLVSNSTAVFLTGTTTPIIVRADGTNTESKSAATAFLSNSALRAGVYLQIENQLSSPFRLAFKLDFLTIPPPSSTVTLPTYSGTAFTYSGPLGLSTVTVGPGKQFPEPWHVLNTAGVLTPNQPFTMNIYPGTYYKPFHVPSGFDGFTIQLAPDAKKSDGVTPATVDDIICNGRGGWVSGYPLWTDHGYPSGSGNPFRLAFGKGFIHTESPGTIKGLGFWYCGGGYGKDYGTDFNLNPPIPNNDGDGEAGIYVENFTSPGTLTIDHCRFDGCENGVFSNNVTSGNVTIHLMHCDFSNDVPNGLSVDGKSHNVYLAGGAQVTVDNCNFFDCNGNSFKSRVANVTINNSFMMQGFGRAIDYPDGGTLTVSNTIFSQKDWSAGGTRIHNFIGIANEFNTRTNTATFTNCTVNIAFEAAFFIKSSTLTWTNPTIRWYDDGHAEAAFSYDTSPGNSDTTGVVGITVPSTAPNGTTFINGYPGRNVPGVVARQSLV